MSNFMELNGTAIPSGIKATKSKYRSALKFAFKFVFHIF